MMQTLAILLGLAAQAVENPVVATGPLFGESKAPDVLRAALRHLAGKTGEAPAVLGGMCSRDGLEGELLCRFTAGGRPVQAQIVVGIRAGATLFLMDDPGRFRANYPRMLELAEQRFRERADWTLEKRRLADGSTISLPGTWRVTGDNRGMISAEGPEGGIDYGCATQAFPPAVGGGWGVLCADYTTPSRIHLQLFPQIAAMAERAGRPSARFVRLLETKAIRNPVGDAEVLDYEWDRLVRGQAERWRSVALVITRNLGGSLFYYVSAVHAPAAAFGRDLRQLLRVWASCGVSAETQQARLDEAAKSLQAVGRIISEAAAFQRETFDRSLRGWSAAFREEETVRDGQTGELRTGGYDFGRLAEQANRAAGWNRFERIDPKDLN